MLPMNVIWRANLSRVVVDFKLTDLSQITEIDEYRAPGA